MPVLAGTADPQGHGSVMSYMICRSVRARVRALYRIRGAGHEALRGDVGRGRAEGTDGDYEQGLASFAEGDQRVDPAQLRRGGVQRAADHGGRGRGDPAGQPAHGRPGEEAVRGGRPRGGAGRAAGASADLPAQGRRCVRGAPGGAGLRRAAGGLRAMVAAPAGRPRGGTRLHRQRLARDRAAGAKKNSSSRGGGSAG